MDIRTNIDKKNKAVIVTGNYRRWELKGVAVCRGEDKFDEDFGRKLAERGFYIEKTRAQLVDVREDERYFETCLKKIKEEKKLLDAKLERQVASRKKFIARKYGEV